MPDDDRDLRQKLKPVFAKFDADKSGSISVSEMGKIVKAIGVEMSEADLAQMMKDGDPDGSGEIDFEEFVTVLKKQMKEGGQMADVFTQATNFFGFLNPLSWFEAKPDGKQGGGLFDWNPSSEKNELQRGMSQTKGDRFDTNLDDDPAGIARKELAKRSKERYAREAAELRSQNSGFFTKVRGTGAKEDDDIMDEDAGRMRLVLAAESKARREEEQLELAEKNAEMREMIKHTPAAFLTHEGSATGIYAQINSREQALRPASDKPPIWYGPTQSGR